LGRAGKKDCGVHLAGTRAKVANWWTVAEWPAVWARFNLAKRLALAWLSRSGGEQRQKVAASSQEFRTRMLSAATKKTFKCLALAAKSQRSLPSLSLPLVRSPSHPWRAGLWGRRRRLRNSFLLLLLHGSRKKLVRSLSL